MPDVPASGAIPPPLAESDDLADLLDGDGRIIGSPANDEADNR